ncbi:MAG: 6-carboxytetrahydropterin synthase, partial [Thermoanaerobaculia bacterium]
VQVAGEVDSLSGLVVDLAVLDAWVTRAVLDRLDHQHLNAALPEFGEGGLVPSSENLVLWIWRALEEGGRPAGVELVGLRLEEDEDLAAEWGVG